MHQPVAMLVAIDRSVMPLLSVRLQLPEDAVKHLTCNLEGKLKASNLVFCELHLK